MDPRHPPIGLGLLIALVIGGGYAILQGADPTGGADASLRPAVPSARPDEDQDHGASESINALLGARVSDYSNAAEGPTATREAIHPKAASPRRHALKPLRDYDHTYSGFLREMDDRLTSRSIATLVEGVLSCGHAACANHPGRYLFERRDRASKLVRALDRADEAGFAVPDHAVDRLTAALVPFVVQAEALGRSDRRRAARVLARATRPGNAQAYVQVLSASEEACEIGLQQLGDVPHIDSVGRLFEVVVRDYEAQHLAAEDHAFALEEWKRFEIGSGWEPFEDTAGRTRTLAELDQSEAHAFERGELYPLERNALFGFPSTVRVQGEVRHVRTDDRGFGWISPPRPELDEHELQPMPNSRLTFNHLVLQLLERGSPLQVEQVSAAARSNRIPFDVRRDAWEPLLASPKVNFRLELEALVLTCTSALERHALRLRANWALPTRALAVPLSAEERAALEGVIELLLPDPKPSRARQRTTYDLGTASENEDL